MATKCLCRRDEGQNDRPTLELAVNYTRSITDLPQEILEIIFKKTILAQTLQGPYSPKKKDVRIVSNLTSVCRQWREIVLEVIERLKKLMPSFLYYEHPEAVKLVKMVEITNGNEPGHHNYNKSQRFTDSAVMNDKLYIGTCTVNPIVVYDINLQQIEPTKMDSRRWQLLLLNQRELNVKSVRCASKITAFPKENCLFLLQDDNEVFKVTEDGQILARWSLSHAPPFHLPSMDYLSYTTCSLDQVGQSIMFVSGGRLVLYTTAGQHLGTIDKVKDDEPFQSAAFLSDGSVAVTQCSPQVSNRNVPHRYLYDTYEYDYYTDTLAPRLVPDVSAAAKVKITCMKVEASLAKPLICDSKTALASGEWCCTVAIDSSINNNYSYNNRSHPVIPVSNVMADSEVCLMTCARDLLLKEDEERDGSARFSEYQKLGREGDEGDFKNIGLDQARGLLMIINQQGELVVVRIRNSW